MTIEEKKEYVEEKAKMREEIQNKINKVDKQRRDYIADQINKGQDNTLDAAMLKIIREQAAEKNYEFE